MILYQLRMPTPEKSSQVVAESLRKLYNDFVAVENSSFTVESGEVFGIVGPNGAGKTTTLKMLAGLISPSEGRAEIAGINSTDSEMRRELGFLPEESPLYEEMTGVSYLHFFASLNDVPRDVASERIHSVLDELDLEHRDRRIGNMSKGMTRKVAIARSLVNDPSVVIYDEPASGLDPKTTNHIVEFTRSLSNDGKAVVFSAHNLYHVESVCDRIALMNNGEVVAQGSVEELKREYGEKTFTVVTDVETSFASEKQGNNHVSVVDSVPMVDDIRDEVRSKNGTIVDMTTEGDSLEDIFLKLTSDSE